MSQDRRPVPTQSNDTNALTGWVRGAARQARLAWQLFLDKRVPLLTKAIPTAAVIYVIAPDLVPAALLPVIGTLDDVAVFLIGLKLFIDLSPTDVVREHLRALGAQVKDWRVVDEEGSERPVVIDGEYQLKESEEAEDAKAGDV